MSSGYWKIVATDDPGGIRVAACAFGQNTSNLSIFGTDSPGSNEEGLAGVRCDAREHVV